MAQTSMAPIEPHHNSFSLFLKSHKGSDADYVPPCNSTVKTESASPRLNTEQRKALDITPTPTSHCVGWTAPQDEEAWRSVVHLGQRMLDRRDYHAAGGMWTRAGGYRPVTLNNQGRWRGTNGSSQQEPYPSKQINKRNRRSNRHTDKPVTRGHQQVCWQGKCCPLPSTLNGVTVHQKEDIVINWDCPPIHTGWRDRSDKLWQWSLKAPITMELVQWLKRNAPTVTPTDIDKHLPEGRIVLANNIYKLPSIKAGVRFMHTVCGFPVQSTWLEAIRNHHYVG